MPAYIQNTEKTGRGHCNKRPCPPPLPVEAVLPHSTNISLDQLARQGSNPAATNTAILTAINSIDIDTSDLAKEANATSNKNEILTKIENTQPDLSTVAKQGTNPNATLTAAQAAVVDGNDTSVSVGKEIRSEVGTGSDTAAETGTLFAVVKWIKNKVNAITGYALQGSGNNTLTDLYNLIGYTISEIDGV